MTEFGLFVGGFLFGVFWFAMIALPILYGFPRAAVWAIRGWCSWRAPVWFFLPPVGWTAILIGAGLILVQSAPDTVSYLMQSAGLAYGQWIGAGVMVLRAVFSPSARADIGADFLSMIRPYLTPTDQGRAAR